MSDSELLASARIDGDKIGLLARHSLAADEREPYALRAKEISEWESRMAARPIVSLTMEVAAGSKVEPHTHDRDQLMYASSGVMTVESESEAWVVPPQRALWIPHGAIHTFSPATALSVRNLLLLPDAGVGLPAQCALVLVSPLLRELILRIHEGANGFRSDAHRDRVVSLVKDEIVQCAAPSIRLPMPTDPRIRKICIAVLDNPADSRTLSDWSKVVFSSERTLMRLFITETGLPFAHWRRQARLTAAMLKLGMGETVTRTALEVGYDSPGAFIDMFKRIVGQTPGQYFQ